MDCGGKASIGRHALLVCTGLALAGFAWASAGCTLDRAPDTSWLGRDDDQEDRDAGSGNRSQAEPGVDAAAADAGGRDGKTSAPDEEAGMSDSATGGGGEGEAGCVEDPTQTTCGNGVVDEDEQCDDGNSDDGDGCENDCSFTCSDAISDCPADAVGDCQRPVCIAVSAGAVCATETDESDFPDDGDPCTADRCEGSTPGHTDRDDGYPCENGAGDSGDYCRQGICIDPVCGDGVEGPLEQCDDADTESGDGCAWDCTLEACGNGDLDIYEDCDDGNSDDADGCDRDCEFTCSVAEEDCPADVPGDCRVPACVANANGRVCGEQAEPDGGGCDNQQGEDGDYCFDGTCRDPVCGDYVRGPLEQCDHQGVINGIGCSEQCLLQCPADMVRMPSDSGLGVENAFCMDRYEASRQDADATDQGVAESIALSQAGVLPWYVNPMSQSAFETFQSACAAAGKHLCTREQWHSACTGADRNTYFFGNTWDASTCNSVDTHCQQCCDILGLSSCPTGANCGYNSQLTSEPGYVPETCFITEPYGLETCHVCFHVMPTGSFPQCKNDPGLYDVNGNVWEVVPAPKTEQDQRGYQVRGGAFNCGAASTRFQCTYDATWNALWAGFRCCADID